MSVEPRLMTADELLRLPRGGARHELVRGALRTYPLRGWLEGSVISAFHCSLAEHVRANHLGEMLIGVGFHLETDPDTVREAPVAFLGRERVAGRARLVGYPREAPDLVLEVVSSTDFYLDVGDKVAEWLEHGARLVFVVNPRRRTVAVHRPGQPVRILGIDDTLHGEDVVAGWRLPARELFS